MILQVCAVYDSAVQAFNSPMFFRSKGEALRSFGSAVNSEGSDFKKHAHDYSFHWLGEYDDSNASFTFPNAPVRLLMAAEAIEDDALFPPGKRLP